MFTSAERREMTWWLIAGLVFGLIGLAAVWRRVRMRRAVYLVLLSAAAWMPVGAPSAVVFTGWQLLAMIAIAVVNNRASPV
jgi:hypothetical protein